MNAFRSFDSELTCVLTAVVHVHSHIDLRLRLYRIAYDAAKDTKMRVWILETTT